MLAAVMAVEHYTHVRTHTVCIHSCHINTHYYAQTLLTMIPTSVGEVAVALSLNAVGGQQGCVCGSGGLTCAAETGRLRTRGSRGARLLCRGAPGGLMRSRRRQASGRGPECRRSRGGSGA